MAAQVVAVDLIKFWEKELHKIEKELFKTQSKEKEVLASRIRLTIQELKNLTSLEKEKEVFIKLIKKYAGDN